MNSRKILPQGLTEKQELQRQETINRVLRAASDIKSEGGTVAISTLIEYTGLSRSAFAKPHIRELLVEYGYSSENGTAVLHKRKKAKQVKLIAEKDKQIAELRVKNAELEKECEFLRGKLFLAMQELRVKF